MSNNDGLKELPSNIRAQLRRDLCARYERRCSYCLTPVGVHAGTVDHYVPTALGGDSAWENLRWACRDCNERKGDMAPEDWERVKPAPQVRRTAAEDRAELLARIARMQRPRAAGATA